MKGGFVSHCEADIRTTAGRAERNQASVFSREATGTVVVRPERFFAPRQSARFVGRRPKANHRICCTRRAARAFFRGKVKLDLQTTRAVPKRFFKKSCHPSNRGLPLRNSFAWQAPDAPASRAFFPAKAKRSICSRRTREKEPS